LASALVTSFGDLSTFVSEVASPYFIYGPTLVSLAIGFDYIQGKIDTVHWLYMGTAAFLTIEMCIAAFIAYKTIQAAVNFAQGFAFNYRGGSVLGNQVGLYELGFVSLYLATALSIVIVSFFGASRMWEFIEEREEGAAEGFLGRAFSWAYAIKFFTMGTAILVGTYYSAYSIGETVDNLIGWMDDWDDKEDSEATGSITPGTAFSYDLNYHTVTVVMGWFLFNFIIFAGMFYASNYIKVPELEDCDLAGVDRSYYAVIPSLIATEVDIASCKTAVKAIFRIGDTSGDGYIDRCENAKFLYGLGNSQKYALNYGEEKTLALLYSQICYSRFSE
jgi:hypothetical protein